MNCVVCGFEHLHAQLAWESLSLELQVDGQGA